MKTISYRALAVICLATLAAAGCGRSPVTGPEAPPAAAVSGDLDELTAEGVEKVTICHVPPGNPGNEHTIIVGAPAVPAHLAHGDRLGECEFQCVTGNASTRPGSAACGIGS